MITPEKTDHALLAASSSDRWLHCTPSARLEEGLPEPPSVYAEEGTVAHEVAGLKALKLTTTMKPSAFNKALKEIQKHELYKPEMLTNADVYIDYISKVLHGFSEKAYTAVEKKLDYSVYIPEGYGTSDFCTIADNTLYVVDYKYGQGVPVSAEDNSQMKCYGLGAYLAFCAFFDIQRVVLAIIQPRLNSISEFQLEISDLLEWGESIRPIAEKAYKGEGEFRSGDWCRFCKAKARCSTRADAQTALEDFYPQKPPLISDSEVGDLLIRGRHLAKWLSDLEEYALGVCLAGGEIPGWKAVQGRSVRQFTDMEKAFDRLLVSGWQEAMLYERKPLTLAAVEKLIGKPNFGKLLSEFVETPPGKPTLAEASDKREPIKPITAEADFENNDF